MDYYTRSNVCAVILQLVLLSYIRATEDCDHSIIQQCAMPLYDNILVSDAESPGINGALLRNRETAREICSDYDMFQQCIGNILPRCKDDRIVKSLYVGLGYICRRGKNDFFNKYECIQRSFSNTQMLTCSALPARYLGEVNSRYSDLKDRFKANCKVSRYTTACLVSNITVLCDRRAGDVIFNIMKHSTEATYDNDIISCIVKSRDMSEVSLDLSNIVDDGYSYGTTVRSALSMEQQVPSCSNGQASATTFKLSEITRCVKPLDYFVRSHWRATDASQAIITRRDKNNLCRAFDDFKLCVKNARMNCDLIESHLAGFSAFDSMCNTDYTHIQDYNGCSVSSRRATTRCIQPYINYKAKPNIAMYENVSRLCTTLVDSVECLVDATQIFIDTCPRKAATFGVNLFTSYMATLNASAQVTYYVVTKGVCPVRLPAWHVDDLTGKLAPSRETMSGSYAATVHSTSNVFVFTLFVTIQHVISCFLNGVYRS